MNRLSAESLSDEGTASVNDHRVAANDINLLLMGFQYYLLGYRAKSPQATAASDNHFAISYDITFYLSIYKIKINRLGVSYMFKM